MKNTNPFGFLLLVILFACQQKQSPCIRENFNDGWKFMKYADQSKADTLIYDVRPPITDTNDAKDADSKPTEAVAIKTSSFILKPWIMPTGNAFIKDSSQHYSRPAADPAIDFPFVKSDFDDSNWESVTLPHDWAISGPFYEGWDAHVGGGMGRLPSDGVAWYRKAFSLNKTESNKNIYLDIDGAMSHAMVWINGHLAGGWPYGYTSFRIDLTPYVDFEKPNQIAIRLDNPNHSSRWYPGGGIYRNVWLVKTEKIHVAQWGTTIRTKDVSTASANIDLSINIENNTTATANISLITEIHELQADGNIAPEALATTSTNKAQIGKNSKLIINLTFNINSPKLWGPPPTQLPNLYTAITKVYHQGEIIDEQETRFGIRSIEFDPNKGILVNGERIEIKGVNQHHDLGALGAAWNSRAAIRQLELLKEMGCNAIRLAHNPPAPELLELTDKMGFLVINELYDCWERKKTPHDFHLIFPEWHEQDLRAWIRRDKNAPSVIMWSTGNEVGEQYTDSAGAAIARKLRILANDEDPTRPTTASFNYAKPHMPITQEMEVLSLNYQGEGIRNAPAYAHLKGINTPPLYPQFHEQHPDKVIVSSENAAALSSRGTYIFPVTRGNSAPVSDSTGGDPEHGFVSAYELYTAPFGSSADKVLGSIAAHPYVAGGFIWCGWDYLGEPTPYYHARSSYYGVIDLAGFKKDRFYLYQAAWRPDFPMVHILPHWNWPDRIGKITPVHVFTSGDEVELFLNGESLGRKQKGQLEYRLRWDDVLYTPGNLKAVAYKNGKIWAEESINTTGSPAQLALEADKNTIASDGLDLSFVSIIVKDENGNTVPDAMNLIHVEVTGAGELVATDNGDPMSLVSFTSPERKTFNGYLLAIVKAKKGTKGSIHIKASSPGLKEAIINIQTQ